MITLPAKFHIVLIDFIDRGNTVKTFTSTNLKAKCGFHKRTISSYNLQKNRMY